MKMLIVGDILHQHDAAESAELKSIMVRYSDDGVEISAADLTSDPPQEGLFDSIRAIAIAGDDLERQFVQHAAILVRNLQLIVSNAPRAVIYMYGSGMLRQIPLQTMLLEPRFALYATE